MCSRERVRIPWKQQEGRWCAEEAPGSRDQQTFELRGNWTIQACKNQQSPPLLKVKRRRARGQGSARDVFFFYSLPNTEKKKWKTSDRSRDKFIFTDTTSLSLFPLFYLFIYFLEFPRRSAIKYFFQVQFRRAHMLLELQRKMKLYTLSRPWTMDIEDKSSGHSWTYLIGVKRLTLTFSFSAHHCPLILLNMINSCYRRSLWSYSVTSACDNFKPQL